jgi:hypothetical protein
LNLRRKKGGEGREGREERRGGGEEERKCGKSRSAFFLNLRFSGDPPKNVWIISYSHISPSFPLTLYLPPSVSPFFLSFSHKDTEEVLM